MPLRRSRMFHLVLLAVTAIGPLSMQIFLPALPAIQRDFAVDTGTAQLTLSLSMFAIAVTTLVYGPLSDRFGRRPVLIVGMVIFVIGTVVSAVAPTIELLIAGRLMQGGGGAAGMVLARAMVRDVHGRERSASVIAYLTMAMVLAPMLAPAIGGALTDVFGWRSNFAFVCGIGGITLALVVFALRETLPEDGPGAAGGGLFAGFGRVARRPEFWGYVLQSSFTMGLFFAFISAAPYLMVNVLNRPATEYGLYFIAVSAGFMVGNFIAARLTPRIGVDRMILLGSLLAFGLTLATAAVISTGLFTPLILFGPAAAIAFTNGLVIANAQACAISVDPHAAGTASGVLGFLQMMVAALVAQAVGSAEDGTPWPMLGFMIGCATLAVCAFILTARRRPGPAPAQ